MEISKKQRAVIECRELFFYKWFDMRVKVKFKEQQFITEGNVWHCCSALSLH